MGKKQASRLTLVCALVVATPALASPSAIVPMVEDIDADPPRDVAPVPVEVLLKLTTYPARPAAAGVRHLEGTGIGYNKGYSSLDLLLTHQVHCFLPFLDLRGHVFNDERLAANMGLGLRCLDCNRGFVFGANAYFDYREAAHKSFHQLSFGLEALGTLFDIYVNGYLPIGKKRSRSFNLAFDRFIGNTLQLRYAREYALAGADAQATLHHNKGGWLDASVSLGPYAFAGGQGSGKAAWGGKLRLCAKLFTYLDLEGTVAYDSLFRWTGHGQISLRFPFGGHCGTSCAQQPFLLQRLVQPVRKEEILVVKTQRKHAIAINPATSAPFQFRFVDNTSHSSGTFESPFSTLAAAEAASRPNDVIYVFPGDGTSTGMDTGITLQNGQKLLGASTAYPFVTSAGTITLPPLASNQPLLTNASGNIITCANDNEVAGLHTTAANELTASVSCTFITNAHIHDNTMDLALSTSGRPKTHTTGVQLEESGGSLQVLRNVFRSLDTTDNFCIAIPTTAPGASYLIEGNRFVAQVPLGDSLSTGIELGVGPYHILGSLTVADLSSLVIRSNQFVGIGQTNHVGKPIGGYGLSGTGSLAIENNLFFGCGSRAVLHGNIPGFPIPLVNIQLQPTSQWTVSITGNTCLHSNHQFGGNLYAIGVATTSSPSSACVTFKGNATDGTTLGFILDNAGTSMVVDVSDNVGPLLQSGTTVGVCP